MSRRPALPLIIALAWPAPAAADAVEQAMSRARALTGATRCERSPRDDIVVCADRDEGRRYRLPYPDEARTAGAAAPRGEPPTASAARMRSGSCGTLVQDQCGGGLSVLTLAPLLVKGVRRLVDPDADDDPPPPEVPR